MTARTKQQLYDVFSSGGSAANSISQIEQEFEDLIDSIGPAGALSVAANDASNASKGRADYLCDGTADEVQIQAALDAGGGRVVLSEGTFTLAAAVQVPTDVIISGQGYATKIDQVAALQFAFTDDGAASPDDVIISGIRFVAAGSRSVECMGIDLGVTDGASNILIRNCWFDDYVYASGTPSGIRGIYDGIMISNCHFNSANGTGLSFPIYLSSGGEDAVIQGCSFLTSFGANLIYAAGQDRLRIIGNKIESSTLTPAIEGIDIEGGTHISIIGNSFYNLSVDGILIGGGSVVGGATDVVVSGNTFNACGKTHGAKRGAVSVAGSDGEICYRIIIIGNIAYDCSAGIARIGASGQDLANEVSVINNIVDSCLNPVTIFGNNYDVVMKGNRFTNNTSPVSFESGGTLTAYHNEGHVTENSGTSAIASGDTTKAVAHGLAATPTVINIAFREQGDNDYGRWWVDTIGSANFTLNVTANPGASNLDFGWEAKVR